jgi:hypothetical protein
LVAKLSIKLAKEPGVNHVLDTGVFSCLETC